MRDFFLMVSPTDRRRRIPRSGLEWIVSLLPSPLRTSERRSGAVEAAVSIVAADLRVEGALSSAGVIRIEGTVIGNVQAERQVLVAKGGIVEGDIHAPEAVLDGKVSGSILGQERVELHPSAVIEGDITTSRLVIHEGAVLRGYIRMGKQTRTPIAAQHLEQPEEEVVPQRLVASNSTWGQRG